MTGSELLLMAGALVTLVASPLLLAWRSHEGAGIAPVRWLGWLALLVSIALFVVLVGWPRGVALALLALPIPALILAWWRRDRRVVPMRQRSVQTAPDRDAAAMIRRWLRGTARTLVALPLAFVAASLVVIPVSYLAGSLSGGVVLALALAVLLWAFAALWAFADRFIWRPATALALLALVSALPLWLQ